MIDDDFCRACGASWACEHRGGGIDAPLMVAGPGALFATRRTLADARAMEPVDASGSLPTGNDYRAKIVNDELKDRLYSYVPGGSATTARRPTLWPAPGWRDQEPEPSPYGIGLSFTAKQLATFGWSLQSAVQAAVQGIITSFTPALTAQVQAAADALTAQVQAAAAGALAALADTELPAKQQEEAADEPEPRDGFQAGGVMPAMAPIPLSGCVVPVHIRSPP